MSKKLIIPAIFIALAALVVLWRPPSHGYPRPYRFKREVKLLSPRQLALAKESTLLIIGDRHGPYFAQYIPLLRSKISPLFRNMEILNIAADRQGIHRTLKKLSELPQLPTLVLFLGGYDEFYEEKFDLIQYTALKKSFKSFQDHRKLLLMDLLPALSPLISHPLTPYYYNTKVAPQKAYSSAVEQQKNLELRFKMYEFEIQQLINRVAREKSSLILTTGPINRTAPPAQVCSNSTTEKLEQRLNSLGKKLERGQIKKAISELTKLQNNILGHARFYHLLGMAYYRQGEFKQARKNFAKANSFDCVPKATSHILNNIIRKKAKENSALLIDFDQMTAAHLGKNIIFDDGLFPKKEHYHLFVQQLAQTINRLIKDRIELN